MEFQLWMLLVPPALSAGAIPLARRHPVAAWIAWTSFAILTVAAVVLLALGAAFVQTLTGAAMGIAGDEPDAARGHVDLWFLVPWALGALGLLTGTAVASIRVRDRSRTADRAVSSD